MINTSTDHQKASLLFDCEILGFLWDKQDEEEFQIDEIDILDFPFYEQIEKTLLEKEKIKRAKKYRKGKGNPQKRREKWNHEQRYHKPARKSKFPRCKKSKGPNVKDSNVFPLEYRLFGSESETPTCFSNGDFIFVWDEKGKLVSVHFNQELKIPERKVEEFQNEVCYSEEKSGNCVEEDDCCCIGERWRLISQILRSKKQDIKYPREEGSNEDLEDLFESNELIERFKVTSNPGFSLEM